MRSFVACAALGALLIGGCPQNGAVGGPDYSGIYSGNVVQTTALTPSTLPPTTASVYCSIFVGEDGIPLDLNDDSWGPGTEVYITLGTAALTYTVAEIHAADGNVTAKYAITGTIDGVTPVAGQGTMTLKYSDRGTVEYREQLAFSDGANTLAIHLDGTLTK